MTWGRRPRPEPPALAAALARTSPLGWRGIPEALGRAWCGLGPAMHSGHPSPVLGPLLGLGSMSSAFLTEVCSGIFHIHL